MEGNRAAVTALMRVLRPIRSGCSAIVKWPWKRIGAAVKLIVIVAVVVSAVGAVVEAVLDCGIDFLSCLFFEGLFDWGRGRIGRLID